MVPFSLGRLETKVKILLFIATSILAIGCFVLFLVWPQWVRLAEIKAQYQQEHSRVQVIENFATAEPDADRYLAELDKKLMLVNQMLPSSADISDVLVQMEGYARASGVKVILLTPQQAANKIGYREIPVEMTVKGTFLEIINFIKKIEDGTRFSAIRSITLKSDARQNSLDMNIVVVVYSYGVVLVPPNAPANTPPVPPPAAK